MKTMTIDVFAEVNNLNKSDAYSLLRGLAAMGLVTVEDAPKVPGKRGRRAKLYAPKGNSLNVAALFAAATEE